MNNRWMQFLIIKGRIRPANCLLQRTLISQTVTAAKFVNQNLMNIQCVS